MGGNPCTPYGNAGIDKFTMLVPRGGNLMLTEARPGLRPRHALPTHPLGLAHTHQSVVLICGRIPFGHLPTIICKVRAPSRFTCATPWAPPYSPRAALARALPTYPSRSTRALRPCASLSLHMHCSESLW